MRESRVYLAAVIAVLGFALYLGTQSRDVPAGLRTFLPGTTPIPASTPIAAVPTPIPAPLDGDSWLLDFEASGISPTADDCQVLCTVNSSFLHFEGGHVNVATGRCDFPMGSYYATYPGEEPGLIDIALAGVDHEPVCYPSQAREIRSRLEFVYFYALTGCPADCVLRMTDRDGGSLLVYRPTGQEFSF